MSQEVPANAEIHVIAVLLSEVIKVMQMSSSSYLLHHTIINLIDLTIISLNFRHLLLQHINSTCLVHCSYPETV